MKSFKEKSVVWKQKVCPKLGQGLVFFTFIMMNVLIMGTEVNAFSGFEGVAKSASGELMWIGIIILCAIMLPLLAKRNFIGALVTIIIGGVIVFVIGKPEIIKTVGDFFSTKLGLSS